MNLVKIHENQDYHSKNQLQQVVQDFLTCKVSQTWAGEVSGSTEAYAGSSEAYSKGSRHWQSKQSFINSFNTHATAVHTETKMLPEALSWNDIIFDFNHLTENRCSVRGQKMLPVCDQIWPVHWTHTVWDQEPGSWSALLAADQREIDFSSETRFDLRLVTINTFGSRYCGWNLFPPAGRRDK